MRGQVIEGVIVASAITHRSIDRSIAGDCCKISILGSDAAQATLFVKWRRRRGKL